MLTFPGSIESPVVTASSVLYRSHMDVEDTNPFRRSFPVTLFALMTFETALVAVMKC